MELIGTIASDDEVDNTSSDSEGEEIKGSKNASNIGLAEGFKFEDDAETEDVQQSWDFTSAIADIEKTSRSKGSSLRDKIKNTISKLQPTVEQSDDDDDESVEVEANVVPKKVPKGTQASNAANTPVADFSTLKLSRPLMRAVAALGFEKPTPIQAKAIPFALQGRDICGSAVTGSGKTGAYLLPVLERLLFRPRQVAVTRVLVLTPTRELAQQVLSMLEKLAQFTDIESMLVVGGLSMSAQAARLRGRPDVVVATPGRLIDHVRNSQSVDLDNVEILILDEADRLLEMGFTDEVHEVVKFCPKSKQTMLFSATLTTSVNQLVELSLNRPVRVSADPLFDMASRLVQEFVRIRDSREQDREAMLLALCCRTFKTETIIFCKRKVRAHRLCILFGLVGLRAAELHGNLTQQQRLISLQDFRDGKVDFLLCTDVASRGLDIQGVKTVLNFEMPRDLTTYVHRVGRTARAGRGGRAVTLTGERQRKLMKEVVKRSKQNVKSRVIQPKMIERYQLKIKELEKAIADVIEQETVEKQLRKGEMELTKATNLLEHEGEIMSKPARTWFQSEKEKMAIKAAERKARFERDKNGDGDAMVDSALEDPKSNAKDRRKARRAEEKNAADAEANKRPHRLTRKKRRRLQILEAEEHERSQQAQDKSYQKGKKANAFHKPKKKWNKRKT